MVNRRLFNEIPGAHIAPPVPTSVALLLIRLAVARGVDEASLLQAAGIHRNALDSSKGLLPATDYAALIFHTLAMTGDPCFGMELGMNVPPTLFGFLGLALMCANSLQDALEVGARYAPLGSRFVEIESLKQEEGMLLTFREKMPLGFATQFAIESTIAAWLNCAQHLGGAGAERAHLQYARVSFAWPRPGAFKRYEKRFPQTTFEHSQHQLFVPHHVLSMELDMAQPLAARQARAQCESELSRVRLSDESFISAISDSLALSEEGFPSLQGVANRMGVSVRTLARRLERQGVNFREVVNERRRLEALRLLRLSNASIEEIAAGLGYLNPANFTRAFKRWTGETPSQYRARAQDDLQT